MVGRIKMKLGMIEEEEETTWQKYNGLPYYIGHNQLLNQVAYLLL